MEMIQYSTPTTQCQEFSQFDKPDIPYNMVQL